jgi:hypothetical protein
LKRIIAKKGPDREIRRPGEKETRRHSELPGIRGERIKEPCSWLVFVLCRRNFHVFERNVKMKNQSWMRGVG